MYLDGFVIPVPTDRLDTYLDHERIAAAAFKEAGATRILVGWGDDVPDGVKTSLPRSVDLQPGETVVFGVVEWPSRAARDAGWTALHDDPRMADNPMPFDGMRMIFGGFKVVLDL